MSTNRCAVFVFSHGATAPSGPGPPHYQGFMTTLRHTTLGRTPLDEWSTCHRDLYVTTHDAHKIQTVPQQDSNRNPAMKQPQTHALDSSATGTGGRAISLK